MQYTHACRLEGQEMMHVGIALVSRRYMAQLIEGLCRRSQFTACSYEPDKRYSDTRHIVTA